MEDAASFVDVTKMVPWVRAAIILVLGLILARVLAKILHRFALPSLGIDRAVLLRRFVFYGVALLTVLSTLRELGFSLGVLLGAAGILSVAVGFASQTSASNLISGLFLIAEKPFAIGDVIRVGGTTGEVLSIDLLSVKLRTFDNLFVRVPNETLIKSEIINITRFPIRRYDLLVGVAYKEQIGRVREVLLRVADRNPLCLDQPRPLIIFQGFGESSLDLQVSVWATRENYLALRNSIPEEIKQAFDEAGIEIPFPHRSLYAGSLTEPLPVRLVSTTAEAEGQGAP